MKKKVSLLLVAWYLLFSGFYVAFFVGKGHPELNNDFLLLLAIPYFGFGALFWSLFVGIGEAVIVCGLYLSYLYFKGGKFLYLASHVLVGLAGGFLFRFVGSYW